MRGDTNKTTYLRLIIEIWQARTQISEKYKDERKYHNLIRLQIVNESENALPNRRLDNLCLKFLEIVSMKNTFMIKQQKARINRFLTYIKSSEKQYNNLNEQTQ